MVRKLILFAASLLLAIPASADLVLFGITPNKIQTPQGGISDPTCQNDVTLRCVIFSGTISFTADQYYTLSDISVSIPDGGADVVGNDNYFQMNSPGVLGGDGTPGDTINPCGDDSCYVGGLFEVDVSSTAAYGLYDGTATLVAYDQNNDVIVGPDIVESFQVDVVPEPGMSTLMFFGLASLAAIRRRHHRR